MKTQKILFRTLSLLMALVMFLSLAAGAVVAKAEGGDDPESTITLGSTGTITVTKYATTDTLSNGDATGTEKDEDTVANGYTPLAGVTFKLYQVKKEADVIAYYNGISTNVWELESFYEKAESGSSYTIKRTDYGDEECVYTKVTGADGKAVFSDLPIGLYVLVEESYPQQIASGTNASLIAIPMVNTAYSDNPDDTEHPENNGRDWVYDIFVYPKNKANKSKVTITKTNLDGSVTIPGVEFSLQYVNLVETDETAEDGTTVKKAVVPDPINWQDFATDEDLVTGDGGILTIDGLTAAKFGTQYKLVETSAPDGYIANTVPLYFYIDKDKIIHWNKSTDDPTGVNNKNPNVEISESPVQNNTDLSFTLRNDRADMSKKVQKNGGSGWVQDEQYRLDDTLKYQLTVYVPADIATMKTFTITDTPDKGIDDVYGIESVTIKYGSTEIKANTQKNETAEKGTGFTLEMTNKANSGITDVQLAAMAEKEITIEYTAKLNADAVITRSVRTGETATTEGDGNANTAVLEYSNVTGESDSTYTVKDTARVYTYEYTVHKYKDAVNTGNELGGVEFELYEDEACTKILTLVDLSNGTYRLALADETENTTTVMTTPANGNTKGTIVIQGLENGGYWLKEIKTAANYNLLSKPFGFTVGYEEKTKWQDSENSNFGEYGENEKVNREFVSVTLSDAESSDIINKKGFVLPQTGSMGYLLFCAAGLILIGGGAALIFSDRKKVIR